MSVEAKVNPEIGPELLTNSEKARSAYHAIKRLDALFAEAIPEYGSTIREGDPRQYNEHTLQVGRHIYVIRRDEKQEAPVRQEVSDFEPTVFRSDLMVTKYVANTADINEGRTPVASFSLYSTSESTSHKGRKLTFGKIESQDKYGEKHVDTKVAVGKIPTILGDLMPLLAKAK